MTNKEWLQTLDEFERAVVWVNFGRSIPAHLQGNDKYVLKQRDKWLEQEVDDDNPYRVD